MIARPANFTPIKERIDHYVIKHNGPDSWCWEWQAHRDLHGYGKLSIGRKMRMAHRLSYEVYVEPIDEGMTIDHLCRNRACCNPAHLEVVTQAENTRRSPFTSSSINSKKTHCKRGHDLSVHAMICQGVHGPQRRCKVCEYARVAAWKNKKKENAS